ncbi:MAG TPA: hypothetical protein VFZ61_32735 [Polyangiales bacterium]
MRLRLASLAVTGLLALTAACNEEDDNKDTDAAVEETEGAYLPWAEGNSWTYRVTNNGEVSTKVTTIGAEEEIGGNGPNAQKRAFRVVTKKGEQDETVSWQGVVGDSVVRYREQSFGATSGDLEQEEHWDPYKLHFDGSDEHTQEGADWLEKYQETKIPAGGPEATAEARDRWTVDAPSVEVEVPAGKFKAVVVQKASGGTLKTYWYVRGVGKVKETGGQTEELIEYTVAP